jgi:hypothetical protein
VIFMRSGSRAKLADRRAEAAAATAIGSPALFKNRRRCIVSFTVYRSGFLARLSMFAMMR